MYQLNFYNENGSIKEQQPGTIAGEVLAQYEKSRSFFSKTHRASDRAIYEAQLKKLHEGELPTLSDNESAKKMDHKVMFGVFLLIYMQVNAEGNTSISDSFFSRVMASFMPDSEHNDDGLSNSRLAKALDQVRCTVPDVKEPIPLIALADLETPFQMEYRARVAAESTQAAIETLGGEFLRVNDMGVEFFTSAQKESHAKLQHRYAIQPKL